MKNLKLLDIVEDILKEGKNVWDAPNEWAEYDDKNHATSELKKFPSALRKFFEVKKAAGKQYAIVAKKTFRQWASKHSSQPQSITEWFLEGWVIGTDDTNNPHYIKKA